MKTICAIRSILKELSTFEEQFEQKYQVSVNEAIVLTAIHCSRKKMTPTKVSMQTELTPSHTSKMLRILESKGLIIRELSKEDHRQMFFSLTPEGKVKAKKINQEEITIPDSLKIFIDQSNTL